VPTDRPQELKYQLLRTAADFGHQGAQLQIQEEEQKLSAAQRQAVQNLRIMMDFLGIPGSDARIKMLWCSGAWSKFC
jgi:hypothetical protein